MKIVHVEDCFFPDTGYQLPILAKYMAKQGNEVIIVTSEMEKVPEGLKCFFGLEDAEKSDQKYSKDTGVKIVRVPLLGFISGRAVFAKQLFKIIKTVSPDIVFVHGNDTLTGMRFLINRKKINYPLIFDSHMVEMASKNRFNKLFRIFYKKFISPIIIKDKFIVIRTQDDDYVQRCFGIPAIQCPWISTGTDTALFYPDEKQRHCFREKHEISENDFLVVYAGKLDEGKGGKLLAESFIKIFPVEKKIILLVVGNTNGEYGTEVEKMFNQSKNKILRFPTQKYQDLAQFYQASDLAVFPKQCSLSFYDAQACGLPVVSEDNNINVDRLKSNNGFNFKAGSIEDFREKIIKCSEMSEDEYEIMKKNAYLFIKENYDYEIITQRYMDVIESEYKRLK